MYGRKTSLLWGGFLRAVSLVYGILVRVRHALFSAGILKRKRLDQLVISVGNLTVGGTGKTPAVINIAGMLLANGRRPAVISRGYGRRDESEIVVVSDGSRVLVDTITGGDEPVLIGSTLRNVPVVVGSDRFRACLLAGRQFCADVFILDDGFQHLRVQRDMDIVLIDGADPFGSGRLFPAGILREPLPALSRATAVVITGHDRAADPEELRNVIRRHTAAPIFASRHTAVDLENVMTGEHKHLSSLRRTRVLAVAGIARPQSFFSLLASLGADIRAELAFPDHYQYTSSDLAGLFQILADKRISMIVTTEKDAVRFRNLRPEGIWSLRIELQVDEAAEWEALLLKRT